VWNVLLDSAGNKIWDRNYGGSQTEGGVDLLQSFDGNIICLAATNSSDGQVISGHGQSEYWVIKTNFNGDLLWEKTLGGAKSEEAIKIIQMPDSGFIALGNSYGYNSAVSFPSGLVSNNYGQYDIWMAKIDKTGMFQWDKNLGSTYYDACKMGLFYRDKIFVAGNVSGIGQDVSHFYGLTDGWVVKLDLATGIKEVKNNLSKFTLSPNPVNDELIISDYPLSSKEIEIRDILGRRLLIQSISSDSTTSKIDIRTLVSGLYFVTVRNKDGSVVAKKFVKE
jgi:hypothetical protein